MVDRAPSPFRQDLFKGTRVLVTGGGTGMGRALAAEFVSHGAKVLVSSRDPAHLEPTAKELGCKWHACDVRDPDQVDGLMSYARDDLGGLDVVVNGAAGNFIVPVESMSPNAWKAVVDIVLNGTFHVSRAALPLLKDGGGCIVNFLANYAWGAAPFVAHSGAAKAGVMSLTRTLALEWAPYGVRVNAVTPGIVPTPGAKQRLFPSPEMEAAAMGTIPAGRSGTAEEVAHAVLYLCSPAAAYVTGTNLIVDGGQWLASNPFWEIGRSFADRLPSRVQPLP